MDVISGAALNQYLITDTEEKLERVSMCVMARKREVIGLGWRIGRQHLILHL